MMDLIKSMTGFGRGEFSQGTSTFSVDVRSVNHRYSDISVRMPRAMSVLEEKVREFVGERISRGKVDVYVNYSTFGQSSQVKLDTNLAKAYVDSLNTLKEMFAIRDDISLSLLTRFPDIMALETVEQDMEELWLILKEALEIAFKALVEMRQREGERLKNDLLEKLVTVKGFVEDIKGKTYSIVDEYKNKLYDRIKELTKDIPFDENRLLTEVAIFADKSSIDEEIVRLESHMDELRKALNFNGSVGKKLDFIIQEMNREVNTIGSKITDLGILNNVISIKTEIEKIREQVQNIE
ncbi:MAG TPA: YicC/YloC family endoribonuclease [Clostridia bacterium]|nr:YicC/YloC family endoribonuclease [Clostridia bacterium]